MTELPTETECGDCRHQVKLKRASWELWTDNDQPVGLSQQRRCKNCRAIVVAGIGTEDFMTMLWKHYDGRDPLH